MAQRAESVASATTPKPKPSPRVYVTLGRAMYPAPQVLLSQGSLRREPLVSVELLCGPYLRSLIKDAYLIHFEIPRVHPTAKMHKCDRQKYVHTMFINTFSANTDKLVQPMHGFHECPVSPVYPASAKSEKVELLRLRDTQTHSLSLYNCLLYTSPSPRD